MVPPRIPFLFRPPMSTLSFPPALGFVWPIRDASQQNVRACLPSSIREWSSAVRSVTDHKSNPFRQSSVSLIPVPSRGIKTHVRAGANASHLLPLTTTIYTPKPSSAHLPSYLLALVLLPRHVSIPSRQNLLHGRSHRREAGLLPPVRPIHGPRQGSHWERCSR